MSVGRCVLRRVADRSGQAHAPGCLSHGLRMFMATTVTASHLAPARRHRSHRRHARRHTPSRRSSRKPPPSPACRIGHRLPSARCSSDWVPRSCSRPSLAAVFYFGAGVRRRYSGGYFVCGVVHWLTLKQPPQRRRVNRAMSGWARRLRAADHPGDIRSDRGGHLVRLRATTIIVTWPTLPITPYFIVVGAEDRVDMASTVIGGGCWSDQRRRRARRALFACQQRSREPLTLGSLSATIAVTLFGDPPDCSVSRSSAPLPLLKTPASSGSMPPLAGVPPVPRSERFAVAWAAAGRSGADHRRFPFHPVTCCPRRADDCDRLLVAPGPAAAKSA